ncbi:MAG: tetratricopeptide repeat protein [Geobacteraceae bacterium]|nr:tetratricopeptide repeat protein [Geobacteraceae bacterium]
MARSWEQKLHQSKAIFCEGRGRYSQFVKYLPILLLGFLAYSNTFTSPFIFDDLPNISANPLVRDFSLHAIRDAFTTRRGVGIVTFQLNYLLAKDSVVFYHLTNLLIHLGNSILVLLLLRLMLKTATYGAPKGGGSQASFPLPFFVALLFAVHPLQTQAVTYIIQRFASLATLFYLLAVFTYLKARVEQKESGRAFTARSLVFMCVTALSAFLAVNTKEIAFTIPAAIVLTELVFFGASPRKLSLIGFGGVSLLAALLIKLSTYGTSVLTALNDATRVQSIASRTDYMFTQFRVIVTYIRLIFFPANQRVEYDYPLLKSFLDWRVFCSFLLIVLLIGLAGYLLKSDADRTSPYRRIAAFGILWFFLTLSIESSFIPIIDLIFEHRVYLPMFGALTTIISLVSILAEKSGFGLARLCRVLFLIAIIFGGATFARNSVWGSELSLWTDNVAKSPQSGRAWHHLGAAYISKRNPSEALAATVRSIELDKSSAATWNNLGIALDLFGVYSDRFNRTTEMFSEPGAITSVNVGRWKSDVNNNLGLSYEILGNLQNAADCYRNAVGYNPSMGLAYYNLGILNAKSGDQSGYAVQLQILRMVDPALAKRLQARVGAR